MAESDVSLVVVAYNMERELPRTLFSLSRAAQKDADRIDYEIIVVDNGSTHPIEVRDPDVRVLRIEDAPPSPVLGINRALEEATGSLVGVLIDGARIASPGLVNGATVAARVHARPVIATLAFHLGPDVQMRSSLRGYDQATEDQLLADANWETDPYRLYDISVLAGSSAGGLFRPIAESNALFMPATLWSELEGFDAGFTSPGGGFANHDIYRRACELPDSQLIILPGEATFHQVHGGVATNAAESPVASFRAEYEALRGRPYISPPNQPLFCGSTNAHALWVIERSAQLAREAI